MEIKKAKEIIASIIEWNLCLNGVTPRADIELNPTLKDYSLKELIKANDLVKSNNSRKRKLQEYYLNKNGKSNGINLSMTLDERLIAAIYTALHYPANGEMVALINDVGVGCVTANYKDNESV